MKTNVISRMTVILTIIVAGLPVGGLIPFNKVAQAALVVSAHHELSVTLHPEASELAGMDHIRIQYAGDKSANVTISLQLNPRARIRTVRVDGLNHPYRFNKGYLTLQPGPDKTRSPVNLTIGYTCRFDDPAPVQPLNTDNPGYGVSGTITAAGSFLLSGSGWYPQMPEIFEPETLTSADADYIIMP